MFSPDIMEYVMRIPALLLAVTVHEYAHARVAFAFGDHTAKQQGRLTLNPISHLDPLGTLMIFLVGFGWARPVPVNPHNFVDYRRGMFWVAFAGPLANFLLALIALMLVKISVAGDLTATANFLLRFLEAMVFLNILLGLFNLLPIPPLDGSKILASVIPPANLGFYRMIEPYAPFLLILLMFTGVLRFILFPMMSYVYMALEYLAGLVLFWL